MAMYHTKIIQEIFTNKNPPAGRTGGLSAVTLPFLQLKLGRRVSGDPPLSLLKRKKEAKKEKSSRFTCATRSSITRRLHKELRHSTTLRCMSSITKLPARFRAGSFVFCRLMPANSFVRALRINWFPTREYTAGAGYISRSSGSAAGSAAAEQRCPRSGDRAKPSASEKSVRSSGRLPRVLPVHSPPRPF